MAAGEMGKTLEGKMPKYGCCQCHCPRTSDRPINQFCPVCKRTTTTQIGTAEPATQTEPLPELADAAPAPSVAAKPIAPVLKNTFVSFDGKSLVLNATMETPIAARYVSDLLEISMKLLDVKMES